MTHHVITECEFKRRVKPESEFRPFADSRLQQFYRKHGQKHFTWTEIRDAVYKGEIFCAVKCDLELLTVYYDYFAEFLPLFCTADVGFEYWGEHMQQYAERNGMSTKPRRLLLRE